MISTRMRSFKQPKYAEKAYNKLKSIVTFSSFQSIISNHCSVPKAWHASTELTICLPLSSLRQKLLLLLFFLNQGMSLQYNTKKCGEQCLLNYALQGGIYNSNSNQLTGGMTILLSLQFSSESFSRVGYLNFQQLSPPKFPYAQFRSIKIEPKLFKFFDEPWLICRSGYLRMFKAEIKLTVSKEHANNNNCHRGNRAKKRGCLGGRFIIPHDVGKNSQILRNPLKFAFLTIFGCK